MEMGYRAADLADDGVHALLGRERVADQRDADAMGERSRHEEREGLLLAHLPVAAVDEHQQRRILFRREEVAAVARRRAVAEVEAIGILVAHARAALLPAGDDLRAVLYGRGVVVGGVKRGAIHAYTLKDTRVSRAKISSGLKRRFDNPCSWW